jgi:DNA mismatch repair protein MutS2
MDPHTLELLGYDKVRELLAGYAASSLGRELARRLEPSRDGALVRAELKLTAEMAAALDDGPPPPFSGLHDVRLVIRRAAIGTMLSAEELLHVAETLTCTGAIYRFRMTLDERHTSLLEHLSGVEDLGTVAKTISGCIDGRAHVLDGASPALAAVRQKLFDLDERVKAEVRRLLRDPKIRDGLSYPNATVHGEHYVLPVAINHRHKFPGVVHRVSGTGETVFVEPASIAGLSAERVSLKAEEDREIRKILRRLSGEVGRVAKPLAYMLDVIAKLDLVTAKAKYGRDYSMTVPNVNDKRELWLRDARHPLLLQLFRTENAAGGNSEFGMRYAESKPKTEDTQNSAFRIPHSAFREVIPIDVRLGLGFNLLVVTGPNTGGKTVALKSTGLLALMAQSGMMIPAGDGSTVPIFSHVLSDIGDEQSLEQSLSTFGSHVTRIAGIFKVADANSLVLLDELGAGTDPVEGAALGRAILDQLDHVGCRAIVTTHLGDLKTYAFNNPRAENGAVEFDVETLRPTYRLLTGQFGMSNALRIAKRLGLPPELLGRARKYLRRKRGKTGELNRLQELRREAEKAKVEALAARHEAAKEKDEYEEQKAALAREAAKQAALVEWRKNLKAGESVHVSRFDKAGTVAKVDVKKQVISVAVGLGQWEIPFGEIHPVIS